MCGGCPSLDVTGDCFVDLADFEMLAEQWLTGDRFQKDLVIIPAGTFQMGDSFNEGEYNELPVHTVTVDSFAMDKYEITNGQYGAFLNSEYPSQLKVNGGIVYSTNDTGNSNPYCDTATSSSASQIVYSNNTFSVRIKGRSDMPNDPMCK